MNNGRLQCASSTTGSDSNATTLNSKWSGQRQGAHHGNLYMSTYTGLQNASVLAACVFISAVPFLEFTLILSGSMLVYLRWDCIMYSV